MNEQELRKTARAMVATGKGILAADESTPTIKKRFDSIDVESTESNRLAYREILFTTAGASEHISGVILVDETLRQTASDGRPIPRLLAEAGMIPGIKVDKGAKPLAGHPGEKVTEGLDGLRDRLAEYYELGARFTKWRAVITIGTGPDGERLPSAACIDANSHALARFAALSQEANLVPIVEPEVLMDGTHTIERCEEVTRAAHQAVFSALADHGVALDGMLLKPNMIVPALDCETQATPEQVAQATVGCFKDSVPADVPGVVFLSGGMSDVTATENLNAMNALGEAPWQLSFSYGRALQAAALEAWGGQTANVQAGQAAMHHRARCNSEARYGRYNEETEGAAVA